MFQTWNHLPNIRQVTRKTHLLMMCSPTHQQRLPVWYSVHRTDDTELWIIVKTTHNRRITTLWSVWTAKLVISAKPICVLVSSERWNRSKAFLLQHHILMSSWMNNEAGNLFSSTVGTSVITWSLTPTEEKPTSWITTVKPNASSEML